MIVYIDFETRSRVDLKSGGTDRYFTEAEPTVCTMAVDNGSVRCWDIISREPTPVWFLDAVANPHAAFIAHNAAFDRCVMERLLFVSHGPSSGSVRALKVTLTDSPERSTLSVEFLTSEQIYRKSPTAKD